MRLLYSELYSKKDAEALKDLDSKGFVCHFGNRFSTFFREISRFRQMTAQGRIEDQEGIFPCQTLIYKAWRKKDKYWNFRNRIQKKVIKTKEINLDEP